MKILAVSGSYRDQGLTDQAVGVISAALADAGASVDIVHLRDRHIEFCRNCRTCCQAEGTRPGACVISDDMAGLLKDAMEADAIVLAAPTNAGSITALFKQFQERTAPTMYWPWGQTMPKLRTRGSKPAVVIAVGGAPVIASMLFFNTMRVLESSLGGLGAKAVGKVFIGGQISVKQPKLSDRDRAKLVSAAGRILAALK